MSILSQVQGLPGARAAKTVLSRMVTRGGWVPNIAPSGRLIAGDASRDPSNTVDATRLQAGLLLGKISTVINSLGTVGYYAPSILGTSVNAQNPGDTSITVSVAVAAEILRRVSATGSIKLRGPAVAGGPVGFETLVISAINTTTGVLTVGALANSYIAGSLVQPTDGSDDPITFIPSGYPIQATDMDGTNLVAQEFPEVPIDCIVDSTQLLPVWPTDTSLQAYIVSRLARPGGPTFRFSHLF